MAVRPLLHFTVADGWINDPHGLTYRDGTYHLFFQHLPAATAWAPDCHWGHATGPDLLRWTEQPVALHPGDGDDGCWSGSLVVPGDGDAALFYTSVRRTDLQHGRVRLARPADAGWRSWVKDGVVVEPPGNDNITAFRDPFVFPDRDTWRMLVGASRVDGTAVVFGYRSHDLRTWHGTGPVVERSAGETAGVWTGTLWECVQLLSVDGRHLLVMSVYDRGVPYYVACAVGTFSGDRFEPAHWCRLTYGPAVYAASAYRDAQGRPGLVGWLRGIADPGGAWTGAITVPALVTLDEHDRPVVGPHPNILGRRRGEGSGHWPAGAAVDVEWSPHDDPQLTIVDGHDAPVAVVRAAGGTLTLVAGAAATSTMPWPGGPVRLLLDGPVLEIFCGGALMAAPLEPVHQYLRGTCRYWVLDTRSAPGSARSDSWQT